MTRCPVCGSDKLKKSVSNKVLQYKKRNITIPNYVSYTCGECHESIVDNATLKASSRLLNDFKRKVDGMLIGSEIKAIRMHLGFSQDEMGEILGGGLKAFARYESGEIIQSKAMDNLLRILQSYPNVLNVIKPPREYQVVIRMEDYKRKQKYEIVEKKHGINEEVQCYG